METYFAMTLKLETPSVLSAFCDLVPAIYLSKGETTIYLASLSFICCSEDIYVRNTLMFLWFGYDACLTSFLGLDN